MLLRFSVEPLFHSKDAESWLRVYVPGGDNVVCKGKLSEKFQVQLPHKAEVVCVWWYVSWMFRLDRHVPSCPKPPSGGRLVLCEPTLSRAGAGEVALSDGAEFTLKDIEGQITARATVFCDFKTAIGKPLLKAAATGEDWLKKVRALHCNIPATNITELPRFTFGKVATPYGSLPTWGFALLAAKRARQQSDYRGTLEHLFHNACYFTFLDPDKFDKAPLFHKLEILCEMQTMAQRFLVYVRDLSLRLGGDHLVDDWTRIADAPVPALIEFDCEDGAEETMAQTYALRSTPGLTGALAELKRLDDRYYSCFSIVTLRLGGTSNWVYHALVVKLDRQWLRRKLGLPTEESKFADLPPLVLETTAYTTSNWRFRTPFCTKAMYTLVDKHIEANAKVCGEMMEDPCLYGHLVSLNCPELVEVGIGQVECLFNGKLGIPVKTLMQDPDDRGITFLPCKVDLEMVTQTTNEAQLFPDTPMLTAATTKALKRASYVWPPKAQFVVRSKDVEDKAVMERVLHAARQMGSKVTTDKIEVYGGIGGFNVIVD